LFPLETPLRLSRNMLHGWKDNSVLAKPLAACTHLSATVSKLFEPQVPHASCLSVVSFNIPTAQFFYYQLGLLRLQIYSCIKFYYGLATWWWKIFEDIFICFDATHERGRHADRQTDGQTPHDSIGRAYASHRAAKTSSASHMNFDSFVVCMCLFPSNVSISIQNILKGNLQPKFKGASVWPKSTAVITGVIFTCPGRVGPVFRLDCGLTYFARIALRAWQHTMEPYIRSESRFTDGRTLDTSLKLTTSTV